VGGSTFDLQDHFDPPQLVAFQNQVLGVNGAVGKAKAWAINGNATCSDSGGTCNRVTGANCSLPCVLCAGSQTGTDPDTGLQCAAGLGLPNVPVPLGLDTAFPGKVFLRSAERAVQQSDVDAGNVLADQITIVFRNTCVVDPVGCDPVTCNLKQDPASIALAQVERPSNNFKCYSVKPQPGTGFQKRQVVLEDQFTGRTIATVATPYELCNPVRKEGREDPGEETDADLNDPDAPHLMCYKLQNNSVGPDELLRATDQFGSLTQRVGNAVVLCQPALKSCEERAEEQDVTADCSLEATQEQLAHLECYQAFDAEQPFGTCSVTQQVCSTSADCPESETCEPLSDPVPYVKDDALVLTDQFGDTLSTINDPLLHCNPVTQKTVDDGTPETLTVPQFDPPFPVPDGVEPPQDVHYRCYDIDDTETPDAFLADPRNRYVRVVDQFGEILLQVGVATQLCEPEVKELLQEYAPERRGCGLLGIEALLPIAALRSSRSGQDGKTGT
jgi:hypothetical protein